MATYTELQLDALRELANIGSGTAGTALSSMLARPVDVSVPTALALPLAEAVQAAGAPEDEVTGVVLPITGDLSGVVLMLFTPGDVTTICTLLGVDPGTDVGESALAEIGNILGTSYLNALVAMTAVDMEPGPPQAATDMLAALVETVVLSQIDGDSDMTLRLDSNLTVEGEECAMSFMLVPAAGGVQLLLDRLGLGAG